VPHSATLTGRIGSAFTNVVRWRLLVLGVALAICAVKLAIASNTFGTTDVFLWRDFAASVRENGPIGIYGHQFTLVYNHAPLSGWLLVALNWLTDHGFGGFPTLIRIPASLADIVTAILVFELVRRTRTIRAAGTAGLLVALSPILIVISGFHGNTDPVFVMFVLLAVYLIVGRGWYGLAGASYALAVSVKLVPVVVAPTIAVLLVRAGWRKVGWFAIGSAVVVLPLWVPVIVTRWSAFRHDVLAYAGVDLRQWGLVQLLRWLGLSPVGEAFLAGPGRFVILAGCALLPAILLWRRPDAAAPATGLALVMFLLLTPAFGMQYTSWAIAAAYLVGGWSATAYNLFGSLFVVVVYDHWNSAYPWHWNVAPGKPFRDKEMFLQVPVWLALFAVTVVGLSCLSTRERSRGAVVGEPETRPARGGELMAVRRGP
jgi:hypothetical protein